MHGAHGALQGINRVGLRPTGRDESTPLRGVGHPHYAAAVPFPTVFPVLCTERLVLRELTAGDAPALFVIHSDAETMRYWSSPPMTEIGQAEALVEGELRGVEEQASLAWGVTRRGEESVIGKVVLLAIDLDSRRAEIGYILDRAHWGHGYNNEALTRVVEFAFDDLGLNRIEAEFDPRNAASAKAVRRLGFVEEGLLRERWIVAGEVSDSLMAGLLRSEWEARSAAQ
jgi:RimJ/RimL family protein N-acetyltransferase